MITAPSPAEWVAHAECATLDPEIFFPPAGVSSAGARAACTRCTVLTECLSWALSLPSADDQHGVIAGLTPGQREKLRHPGVPLRAHRRTALGATA